MPQHHPLTLNWSENLFQPDPQVLPVATGDTISFTLGSVPANSKFTITMDERFFLPVQITDSNTVVKVLLAAHSKYTCQLSDANGALISVPGQAGGSTRPIEPPRKT